MAMRPKSGLDVIIGMGGPKKPPVDEYDSSPDANPDDAGLPPEFEMAWRRLHDAPSAENFWAAVESCVNAAKTKSDTPSYNAKD